MIMRSLSVCAFALICTDALSTQGTSPFTQTKTIDATSTTHPAVKRRAVPGEVTGDLRADLTLLDAGTLWVVYDPANSSALVDTGQAATDFALLPPTAAGDASDIAIVDAAGVAIMSDYDGGSYTLTPYVSAQWAGAQRVFAADLDQDGTSDLVGVGSNGTSILITNDITGASPTDSSFNVPSTIFDVAVADWQGSTVREILVLMTAGLRVYDTNGVQLDSLAGDVDAGYLATMRQTGYGYTRAVIVYETAGTFYKQVADATLAESAESFDSLDIVAIAVSDADEDGDGDLLAVAASTSDVLLFDNQSDGTAPGVTPTYLAAGATSIGFGVLGRFQNAWPGALDYDKDGDADFCMYSAKTDEFVYCTNDTIDASTQIITVAETSPGEAGLVTLTTVGNDPTTVKLSLPVDVPGGWDQVQVVAWPQAVSVDFDGDVGSVPTFEGLFAVSNATATLVLELGDFNDVVDTVYYTALRGLNSTNTAAGVEEILVFGLAAKALLEPAFGPGITQDAVSLDYNDNPVLQISISHFQGRELTPVVICVPDVPPQEQPPKPTQPPSNP